MREPAARCVGATAEPRPATGATESLPAEAPAECGSRPSRQRDPGAAGRATSPPPPPPRPKLPRGPRTCTSRAASHRARKGSPRWAGLQGQGPTRRRSSREGGAMSEGGAPNGATARLFGEELQGCGAGLRHGGGATDSASPCSLAGTHFGLVAAARLFPTPLGLPAPSPFPRPVATQTPNLWLQSSLYSPC